MSKGTAVYKYRIRKQTFGNGDTQFTIQKKEVYIDKTYGNWEKFFAYGFFFVCYPLYRLMVRGWEFVYKCDDLKEAMTHMAKIRGEQYDSLITKEETIDLWK